MQYDESFAVIGPRLWNVLPMEISEMNDLRTFKEVIPSGALSVLIGLRLRFANAQTIFKPLVGLSTVCIGWSIAG